VVVAGVLLILGAVVGWLMFSPWYPLKSGQSALADGDYAGAVEGFSQALERDTDNVEAIEGLLEAADNLAQAGQLDDAITAYETVRGVKPGEVQALRGLGQVYEAKGELGEAAGWYEKWTQATPEEGSAFLALGSARFNLGEYEGAVVAYEQAKALGAGAAEMDTHLGLAYYELAQYDKAVEHLQNAVGQTPEDFELQRALGVSLYDQDQLERALEHLNKAVALGADRPGDELLDVYYALGGCHFGVQDYEQAVSFYRQAQELDPEGQAIWAGEARANLDEAYSKLALDVMGSAMFDLDFSNIATEEGETYAIAKTGQMVKIEGAVHLVDGPWEGSQALVVEEDTANRCPNPSAETGVVGYATQYSGVPEVKVSQETGFGLFGAKCIRIASSDASAYVWNSPHAHAPASSNSTWHDGRTRAISAWVLGTGTWRVVFENSGQHLGAYTEVALASTWQRVEVTATNSSGIDYSSYRMSFFPMSSGNTELYVDGVQYEEKGHATTYCDGDQGDGYSWSRTPHAGVSSRQATTLNLDDHVNLISGNDALSFRVRAQMPYSYDAPWHVTYPIMFDARGADNDNRILLGYHTVDDVFYLFVNGSTKATKSLSFSAGDWIDFIGTLDFSGDSYSLYVNGELAGTDSASLTVPTLTSWRIGSTYNGTSIGNYAISESVVFDRALTVNEVEALYRVGTFASR
jgi:tetratricopeptide (TPR) repeat protein